jgi:Fe-S-cluster-containing dehydrogenase component
MDRRSFIKTLGAVGATALAAPAAAEHAKEAPPDAWGVLVDTTSCIGCRKCEWACNDVNGLPGGSIEAFEDKSVFAAMRRPEAEAYTVVNQSPSKMPGKTSVWTKVQCMHCNDPACASVCLVSALEKDTSGAVVYDPWRCMGCRYCMVACPFQIPAYQYADAFSPEVRKCTFCITRIKEGKAPGCVSICPAECLIFGKREVLLGIAHKKIADHPGRYIDHVYGEHEVGGTSWMYLAGQEFESLDLPVLGEAAPPRITEGIQHGVFKGFIAPITLYAVLGQIMWLGHRKQELQKRREAGEDVGHE